MKKRGKKNNSEKIKKFLNKFWQIVWKDESPKGWLISLVFLFIVIKLIFFPLMTLITGTALPLVIVESCSMYHQDNLLSNFDSWWLTHQFKYKPFQIDKTKFSEFSFKKGFNKGDILFVTGANPEKLKVGDIIIFNANYANPIIHRIVKIESSNGQKIFSTMGDNNNAQLPLEMSIKESQIIGKARATIAPYFGWIKLIFFEWTKAPNARGFCNTN